MQYASFPHSKADTQATTGAHAPSSGWWRNGEPGQLRYIQQGEIMPAINGEHTRWILMQALAPAKWAKHSAQPALDILPGRQMDHS